MTATNVEAIADKIVSSGLAAAGYTYVNLDDCWANAARMRDGSITGSPEFPSMKALASYVHSKGLKFGLYTSENNKTCAGRPGSYGYELMDSATYCDWGVDFVKIDHCGTGAPGIDGPSHMNESWVRFRQGFDKCVADGGRPMVMSVEYCTAPVAVKQCVPWFATSDPTHDDLKPCVEWVKEAGANMWRVASDIAPKPTKLLHNAGCASNLPQLAGHWNNAGGDPDSGHWNDLDMLQVGNGGLSVTWERIHFSLWAILAAPLLISTDLTTLSDDSLSVLLNRAVISVNQDGLGKPGLALRQDRPGAPVFKDGWAAWAKPLSGGDVALLVINTGNTPLSTSLDRGQVGLPAGKAISSTDLWTGITSHTGGGAALTLSLNATDGFAMLRLRAT